MLFIFFFFNDTATTEIYTLSLQTLFRSQACSMASVGRLTCLTKSSKVFVIIDGSLNQRTSPYLLRRSEEHTSELQSLRHLVCRLLLEKKKQHRQVTRVDIRMQLVQKQAH